MSRVQLALNVDRPRRGGRLLLQALRHRTGQAPPGLRQLRHRRSAAQAGPDRRTRRPGRRRGGCAQPPGRRGGDARGGRGRLPADWRRRAWPTRSRRPATCCYAVQDKAWVSDPDGAPWEVYTVLADATEHRDGIARSMDLLCPAAGRRRRSAADVLLSRVSRRPRPADRAQPMTTLPCGGACWPSSWAVPSWPRSSSARDRRPTALARQYRPPAAGERRRHRGRPLRHHLDVRSGLGRPLQPRGLLRRRRLRRDCAGGRPAPICRPRWSAASAGRWWPT